MSSNLPLSRNWGQTGDGENQTLINELDDMYFDIANAISPLIKKNVIKGANPPANAQINTLFSIGDITVRTDTDSAWIMTSRTSATAVTWKLIT